MKLGFDLNTEEAADEFYSGFTILAPGWYQVVIVESDIKPTKAGTGKFLELKMETKGGETITDRLNILNQNEVAQKIGRAALGKIAVSCGIKGALTNTDKLHGRPFEVKLEIEEFASNTSGEMLKSNKVKDYRAIGTAAPASEGEAPTKASGW